MTHSNHRQGTVESLSKDYVVFLFAAGGINDKDSGPKLREFLRLAFKHDPVNAGSYIAGTMFTASREEIVKRAAGKSIYTVFDNKEKAKVLVKDLVKADLGLSVVVSGLFDEVDGICQAMGIKRHTAQCSLGVWGNVKRLPEKEILDISTMCGHGMVSFNLVRRMASRVRNGSVSLEEATGILAKPCACGIFNPKRAEELLKECIAAGIGE